MTKEPHTSILSTSKLLELSMSVGQDADFQANAKAFTDCLKKLLNFTSCELWILDNQESRSFFKIHKNVRNIIRSTVLEKKHRVSKFKKNQFYHSTLIEKNNQGIFEGFTNLEKGIIHRFKLSEKALLIGYDSKTQKQDIKANLSLLEPIFHRFNISLEQSYAKEKIKKLKEGILDSKEELQKYKLVVENVSEGLLIFNKNLEVVFANDRLSELSEFPTEEIIGKPAEKLIRDPNHLPFVNEVFKKVFNGSSVIRSLEHIKKISQEKWRATTKITPYKNDKGEIVGAIAIIQDITERYNAQKILKDNENRLTKLFEMSPVPILIRSIKNSKFKQINQKFIELFGYTLEELNSRTRDSVVHWEDAKFIKKNMEKLLSGDISTFKTEKQYIRKDGTIFWGAATRSLIEIDNELFIIGFVEDITERKKAINAFRESEAKLRAIIDSTADKIIALDRNLCIIDFNKSAEKFITEFYPDKQLKKGDYYAPVNPDTGRSWTTIYNRSLEGETFTITREYYLNNEYAVDLINILPIKDNLNNIIGVTLYGREITALNKAQKALQKNEFQLVEAQRIAKTGNWEYDVNTNQIKWSKGTFRLLNIPTDSIVPTFESYLNMIHPEDRQTLQQEAKNTIKNGTPYELELRHFTQDKKLVYLIAKGEALMKEGRTIKLFGTVQDITDLKKVELELIEYNKKYQDLFNNMYDALLVTDNQGYFVDANKAAQRLLEYSFEELKKIRIPDIVHPEDKEKSQKYLQNLKKEGFYSNYEGRVFTKTGKIKYLQVNSNAIIKNGEMVGSRDIARDITALKTIEEKREQLLSELEAANNELKDFAYIVSHDLKAPLRAISSLSKWIAEDYKDLFDEEGKKHVELLIGRANRMQSFIEGILQYSRLGRIKLERTPVCIKGLIETVIDSLDPPKNFTIKIDSNIPDFVECEQIRIYQVFQNLISNAIKYNDKSKGLIHIKYQNLKEFHEFIVEDNGPGIEEKHFEKIFKIFQTLQSRDQLESTGIGLTIIKRIVELHGGKIKLNAILGEGSKFSFTILK